MTRFQRSVLVVGPAWIGDMVMAQSLFASLTLGAAGTAVDVVAPPGPLALTKRMPEVREAFPLPIRHGELGMRRRWAVARTLRARKYDRAIVLPSSFKSALVPWFARIPVRTGYRGEWRFGLINDFRAEGNFQGEKNVRGYHGLGTESDGEPMDELPLPSLRVDPENQERLMDRFDLRADQPIVALAPGAAYGPAKRWPLEYFREVAIALADTRCSVWVLGGQEEREAGSTVLEGAGEEGRNLCGRTSITDVVDLLSLAAVTVTNDSGLMHVAAATGGHVVALYGPTPPAFAPPLTSDADIFYLGTECSPCFERRCPLGHHRCLRDISPGQVLARIATLTQTR